MPRFRWIPLALSLVACPGERFDRPAGAGGRFELRAVGNEDRGLIAGPALASWCAADSSLTIVALSNGGSGGFAARVAWPPGGRGEPDTLRIGRGLVGPGAATLAYRALGDDIRAAYVADSGTAVLRGESAVSGTAAGWATIDDSTQVRLEAALRGIPVTRRCPGDRP